MNERAVETRHAEAAQAIARAAKAAARPLSVASTERKNRALLAMADGLVARAPELLAANAQDLDAARANGLSGPMLDRLTLDEKRIKAMADGLREVAALPDPVGEETERWTRPNGMDVAKVRLPLGVILVIYEARPNVTADAAGLCVKSGNAVILRGGKEAIRSNTAIARVLDDALAGEGLGGAVRLVEDTDRELMLALLQQDELIDLCIPRGGEGLIRFVAEHARVPVIKHYKGVCHLYVDAAAKTSMAVDLAYDGKVSRPGVCNALECLLVHESVAGEVLPAIAAKLGAAGVEFRADERAFALLDGQAKVVKARPDDYGQEFLDRILAVRVVSGYEDAVDHIARYGSLHTEVVVTEDADVAKRFTRDVEASMVGWNVSTRFNDGGQLGLGAEMGISTTKLHAFGPMGLRELTASKFVVTGRGQVRG